MARTPKSKTLRPIPSYPMPCHAAPIDFLTEDEDTLQVSELIIHEGQRRLARAQVLLHMFTGVIGYSAENIGNIATLPVAH